MFNPNKPHALGLLNMKVVLFFLFFSFTAIAQSTKESLKRELIAANDTTAVHMAKLRLAQKYKNYAAYFDFIPSINPLNPKKLRRFSSQFGRRFHPIDKKYKQHLGLDISAKLSTPIHAPANGTVVSAIHSNKGCGNSLLINHKFGFTTRYCHMYLFVVKKGQRLRKGQIIGYVGTSGKSTGPHLHYEIKKNGKLIDPYPFCFLNL